MEPVHIADIDRGSGEILRIEISEYKGKSYFNIRTWYKDDAGEWAPTKKGITITLDRFPELAEAIRKAEDLIRGTDGK